MEYELWIPQITFYVYIYLQAYIFTKQLQDSEKKALTTTITFVAGTGRFSTSKS